MKSPTAYGSENEETTFIRRIAAPDRATAPGRKQKHRLAVAGATIGFIAASAVVGYSALRDGGAADERAAAAVPTEQLEARHQAAADRASFVKKSDPLLYPSLEQLDKNGNGIVSQTELLKHLEAEKTKNLLEIGNADLPQEIKDDLVKQVKANYDVDGACVVSAMSTMKKYGVLIRQDNFKAVYSALETICPTKAIESPEKLVAKYKALAAEAAAKALAAEAAANARLEEEKQAAIARAKAEADAETSAPATTMVIDTPAGPAVVDLPA
ncbi:hypothetical protein PybrP1_008570, partial [[Pythium] brassicae (nom. inval.)]